MRKISKPGASIWLWCKETKHYGSYCKKRIKLNAVKNKEEHLKNKEMFLKYTIMPASWIDSNKAKPSDVCSQTSDLLYGVPVNFHDSEACYAKCTSQSKTVVSVKDRTLNTKAFILSFAVGNSLQISKVPKLVEFAKFLSISFQEYHRKNILYGPVNTVLGYHMRTANC